MNIKDFTRDEIIEIIKEKRLFTQKDLSVFFDENTKGVIVNELVKYKIRLSEIKREEIKNFIVNNPYMKLKEVSKIFGISVVTLVRIKNKYKLARKQYVNYKKIKTKKLEKTYKECNYVIGRLVLKMGGTPVKWREELQKRGLYKYKLSEKYKNRGYKKRFLKEIKDRGEALLKCKAKTIAGLIGCSERYAWELKRQYKKEKGLI